MPGGHRALEVSGSTRDVLRLSVIDPSWPFPKPAIDVARVLCKKLPMRYYHGQLQDAPF
jgi:hypothetical protein